MQHQIDQKSNDENQPYHVKSDLKDIHEAAKETVLSQVRRIKKHARTHTFV